MDSGRSSVELDTILERAHEAYIAMSADGRIAAWNPEAERTFGWSRDAALGSVLRDLIVPPRFRSSHDHGLQRFVETGDGPLVGRRVEIVALHRNGNEFPVELTISAIRSGDAWTFHAFVHDISDRYRAAELQARLAAVVEHSVDAIITRGRDGKVTTWNPGAERLYGFSAQEAIGRTIDLTVSAERKGEAEQLFRRALAGEAIASYETVRRRKDGSSLDVSLTLSPIRDDGGVVNEVSMIARDIGARKQAERALAEALELKAQFVAVASHELRTPLTSIAGFTTTLLARWEELADEERLSYLRIVEEQSTRLQRLVDDVLLLSRIDAGGVAVRSEGVPTDLAEVARAVVAEIAPEVDVRIDVAGDGSAAIAADAAHRIVLNFVANALAYGRPPLVVEVAEEGSFARVSVLDAGDGVPAEAVALLFSAFTQAAPVSSRGAGLGLAIVRGLVESAGGSVSYEPGANGGSRFSARLPRR